MLAELIFGRNRLATSGRSAIDPFWYTGIFSTRPTASNVDVNQDTALTYSAVWAATRLLSSTGGRLPINLYRKRASGGRDVASKDRRHWMVHSRPNHEMVSMVFRSSLLAYQINYGNAYAEIQRAGSMPVALWPIHPSRVKPMRTESGELVYEVSNNDFTKVQIPAADMLHIPSMMSPDGISGLGVIQYAREAIGFGIATERYGSSWFGSGGMPRIVVTHPQKLSDDARTNFRTEWAEMLGKPDAQKVALLAEGAQAVPLSISAEDSQFLETRQFNIEEIARWYNVPPHMLQHLDKATFNNIEHLGIEFVVYSLAPWMKIWEQQLSAKLLTENEQQDLFFETDFNALLKGDSKTRSEFYRAMLGLGVFSLNEVRELENFNPFPGGDLHYIQGAMEPIGPDGKLSAQQPEPEALPEPEDDDVDEPEESDDEQDANEESMSATIAGRLEDALSDMALTAEEALARVLGEIRARHESNGSHGDMDGDVERIRDYAQRETALKVAARILLEQAGNRIVKKHAQAARRAAKNPKAFLDWNDAFADENAESFRNELEPCVQAFHAIGIEADANSLVEWHLTHAREELLEASGVPLAEFSESIESCVSDWQECRAQVMADAVFKVTMQGES